MFQRSLHYVGVRWTVVGRLLRQSEKAGRWQSNPTYILRLIEQTFSLGNFRREKFKGSELQFLKPVHIAKVIKLCL